MPPRKTTESPFMITDVLCVYIRVFVDSLPLIWLSHLVSRSRGESDCTPICRDWRRIRDSSVSQINIRVQIILNNTRALPLSAIRLGDIAFTLIGLDTNPVVDMLVLLVVVVANVAESILPSIRGVLYGSDESIAEPTPVVVMGFAADVHVFSLQSHQPLQRVAFSRCFHLQSLSVLGKEVVPHRVITLEEAAAFMIAFGNHVAAPLVNEEML